MLSCIVCGLSERLKRTNKMIVILNDNTLAEVADDVLIGDAVGDCYVIGLLAAEVN